MNTHLFQLMAWLFCLPHLAFGNEKKLFVDDPRTLQQLEANGFDFSRLAFALGDRQPSTQFLFNKSEKFRRIVETVDADLDDLRRKDKRLAPSMADVHRQFNSKWLNSPSAFFELVGVVNRIDRAPFKLDSCGEIRAIYRLAYRTPNPIVYSRLPMTVNVVFWVDQKHNCALAAKAWDQFAQMISSDPAQIKPEVLALVPINLKSIELNLQSVRWPSTVRPDMGGYAEYILRVFKPSGATLTPSTLENTPDVEHLAKTPALKKKLLNWLKDAENLAAIDSGVPVIPEEFLATRATSVALQGVHRLANAPFTQ